MKKPPVCLDDLTTVVVSISKMKEMYPKSVERPQSRIENNPVNTQILADEPRNEEEHQEIGETTPKIFGGCWENKEKYPVR